MEWMGTDLVVSNRKGKEGRVGVATLSSTKDVYDYSSRRDGDPLMSHHDCQTGVHGTWVGSRMGGSSIRYDGGYEFSCAALFLDCG